MGFSDPRRCRGVCQVKKPSRVNWVGSILAGAAEILHKRTVTFVGFNNTANEVIVYTKTNVLKKETPELPDEIDGVRISYERGGAASVTQPAVAPFNVPALVMMGGRYSCGSSVHVGNNVGAGTLGCLVRDSASVMYGLSNNHVTGSCNHADPGLPIVAPGACDVRAGGHDPFTIGHHARLIPMTPGVPGNVNVANNTDAAIFRLKDPMLVTSMQRGAYDTPSAAMMIAPGMEVEKVGRTTGHTQGIVRGRSGGPHPVYYAIEAIDVRQVVYFDPMFAIESIGPLPFVDLGDSGSVITHVAPGGQRYAVGIAVAISQEGPNRTYALPL